MTNDRFWKSFWILSTGSITLCLFASISLFFVHIGRVDTAAVGVSFDPLKDPFQTTLRQSAGLSGPVVISDGYILKDSLPVGVSAWNWSAMVETRSSEKAFQGKYALKVTFVRDWAGVGLGGFTIDNKYKTLSLAVYPDNRVEDLYIELYNNKGVSLGRQSLGFYTATGSLVAEQWQTISIPVENLVGSSTATSFSALSISTTHPGIAYVDEVRFTYTPSSHAPWVYKAPEGGVGAYVPPPFNPFATSTAVALPYTLEFKPYDDDAWYSSRGFFRQDYDAFRIGPLRGVTSDAFVYFRGGRQWADYQASGKVAWGTASVFALIVRMQDEKNYVSCSYSSSGDTIQMYSVKDGISTTVTQSDKLHYADYNGGIVMVGALVHGNTLVCGLDGRQILSEKIENMPTRGTVGFEAWDQNDTLSAHEIQSFTVTPAVGE